VWKGSVDLFSNAYLDHTSRQGKASTVNLMWATLNSIPSTLIRQNSLSAVIGLEEVRWRLHNIIWCYRLMTCQSVTYLVTQMCEALGRDKTYKLCWRTLNYDPFHEILGRLRRIDGAKTNTLLKSCIVELFLKVLKHWWFGKEFWPTLDILYIVYGVSKEV